ncbi:RNA-dependent ATPase rok1 [Ophidiomyces ophidiicola]|nr:RNA-dependent ATPase rok1 [Ophidiomyces ophidiicola]KAI2075204.1 RNA-dependent ATPase rok1 [Ophidiomyces ophidiicola]KAI2139165.1 RNA-dependent ATPase rok1 [Ophidiomyces ophidiicola]KAI2140006.1 RNA-dependent ATPase rok1 [Ophidiomyces ophidiicola]KAI2220215.1 RNA-dependent ATPase rok1 [Ophidiomyces ophidiicola]
MDVFKLLTRSTRLKRTSTCGSSDQLPSAGAANTPQLFPDRGHSRPETSDFRGLKRKRNVGEDRDNPGIPDFFGSKPTANSPASSSANQRRTIEAEDDLSSNTDNVCMPEEERKSILKSHKIKITDLGAPIQADFAGTSKSKKRKSQVETARAPLTRKQRKAAQRIFPEPLISFGQLRSKYRVSKRLCENIYNQGYTVPTEVQLGSLPLLLGNTPELRQGPKTHHLPTASSEPEPDLLVVAPTGSGKTLAFMIPLITKVLKNRHENSGYNGISSLVIAPTKELVTQIVNEGRKLTAGTAVKVTAMRKGMRITEKNHDNDILTDNESNDENRSSSDGDEEADEGTSTNIVPLTKCDILVSTPLLLVHALSNGDAKDITSLPSVQTLVFDEADVLLDPLFREQTLGVWKACSCPQLRVGLWSATMGSNIEELAKSTVQSRQSSSTNTELCLFRLVVGLKDSAIPNISHKLVYAATEQGKLLGLRQLLHPSAASSTAARLRPPFLIFTQTIARAVALHSELMYDIPSEAGGSARIAVLHSELSDSKRSDVMAGFRKGEIWVLITTDLLARGVDFRGINGVVNYDIPNSSAGYVHRVGRTGRAGREGGVAVTFYTKEDIPYVKNIANVISASEKLRGTSDRDSIPKWLMKSLPTISKNDKKDLKKYGVQARRPSAQNDPKTGKKTRISTKSGFDRRVENNRRGAIKGNQSRKIRTQSGEGDDDYGTWSGIED